MNRAAVCVLVAAALAAGSAPRAQPRGAGSRRPQATGEARHLDARIGLLQSQPVRVSTEQQAALAALRAQVPDVRVELNEVTGATHTLWNPGGFLTAPDTRDAQLVADDFIRSKAALLGLTASDVVDVELVDRVYSRLSGVTHLYYQQRLNGVPVYNAQLHVNVAPDGRVLSVNNGFLPDLTAAVHSLTPAMDAVAAVGRAADHLELARPSMARVSGLGGIRQAMRLSAPDLSTRDLEAALVILPVQRGLARLAWNFQVWTPDGDHAFDYTIDAESGQVWTRSDWVAADQYRVYARPVESPAHGAPATPLDGRSLVGAPADPLASPFGWHDVDGKAGADFNTTRGNNVHAYTDLDADDRADSGSEAACGTGLSCDFSLDLTLPPSSYRPAAVTNLFYWTNLVHDVHYRYGFDEEAGNFQVNTYDRGGRGNDAVRAEAQDGLGVNNANFATPPDGSSARMQMYTWVTTSPSRDGGLDGGIIVHEYGHGISNRLVGGPSNVNCLANPQQPGEGISDFFTLAYTARPGDTAGAGRGIGTYAMGQAPTGQGIRAQRYSTSSAVNTWTYESINGASRPHGVGAVWAQALWEVYWALVDAHGFDDNLYDATGEAGNLRAMLYVTEGLKNTACSPTFTQARDGVIQAAQSLHGGEDVCRVWTAFAAFGLGIDAVSSGPSSTVPVNGFSRPAACGGAEPMPPVALAAEAVVGNTVTLRWTPPPGGLAPTGYVVEGGLAMGQVLASLPTGSVASRYTFAAPNGAFHVRVHTLSGGARSAASNEIKLFVNVPQPPGAPSHLLGLVNGSTAHLAWKGTFTGGAPTGYILDVNGPVRASVAMGPLDRAAFTNVPDGTYTVVLRATNAAGTSPPTDPVILTVPGMCGGPPQAPAGLWVERRGATLTASWDPPADGPAPTGYVLGVSGALLGEFPTTGRSLTGVVGRGTYEVSVRATTPCGTSPPTPIQLAIVP
jgi:extracellular elastinolytic metalloproteinase